MSQPSFEEFLRQQRGAPSPSTAPVQTAIPSTPTTPSQSPPSFESFLRQQSSAPPAPSASPTPELDPNTPMLKPRVQEDYSGAFGRVKQFWDQGVAQLYSNIGYGMEPASPGGSYMDDWMSQLRHKGAYERPPDTELDVLTTDWKSPSSVADLIIGATVQNLPQLGVIGPAYAIHPLLGYGASYILNKGESYQNLLEQGIEKEEAARLAEVGGHTKALLDVVGVKTIMTAGGLVKRFVPKDLPKPLAAQFEKELNTTGWRRALDTVKASGSAWWKGARGEAPTEAGQEGIDILLEKYAGIAQTPGAVASRILNAGVQGAIAGGNIAGAGRLVTHPLQRRMIENEQRRAAGVTADPMGPGGAQPADPGAPVDPTAPVVAPAPETTPEVNTPAPTPDPNLIEPLVSPQNPKPDIPHVDDSAIPQLDSGQLLDQLPQALKPPAQLETHPMGQFDIIEDPNWTIPDYDTVPGEPIAIFFDADGETPLAEITEITDPFIGDPTQGVFRLEIPLPDSPTPFVGAYSTLGEAMQAGHFAISNIVNPHKNLAPTDLRQRFREQVVNNVGAPALFETHSGSGIRTIFQMPSDAPLDQLLDQGIIRTLPGQDQYTFSPEVSGQQKDYFRLVPGRTDGATYSQAFNRIEIPDSKDPDNPQAVQRFGYNPITGVWTAVLPDRVTELPTKIAFHNAKPEEILADLLKHLNKQPEQLDADTQLLQAEGWTRTEEKRFAKNYLGGEVILEISDEGVTVHPSDTHPHFAAFIRKQLADGSYYDEFQHILLEKADSVATVLELMLITEQRLDKVDPFIRRYGLHDAILEYFIYQKQFETLGSFIPFIYRLEGRMDTLPNGTRILHERTQASLSPSERTYYNRAQVIHARQQLERISQYVWNVLADPGSAFVQRLKEAFHYHPIILRTITDTDPQHYGGFAFEAGGGHQHGVHRPIKGRFYIGVNLLGEALNYTQSQILHRELVDTILHEFTHYYTIGHKWTRLQLEGYLQEYFYQDPAFLQMRQELLSLVRDPNNHKVTHRQLNFITGAKLTLDDLSHDTYLGPIDNVEPVGITPSFFATPEDMEMPSNSLEYQQHISSVISQVTYTPPASTPSAPTPAETELLKQYGRLARQLRGGPKDPERLKKFRVAQGWIKSYFRQTKEFMTLLQLADQFKNLLPMQVFAKGMEQFSAVKTKVLLIGMPTAEKWMRLNHQKAAKLAAFILRVSESSFKLERRLTAAEMDTIATRLGLKAMPELIDMAADVDASFQQGLERMRTALIEQARRIFISEEARSQGITTTPAFEVNRDQINKEFARMAQRNYFPFYRFGQWGLIVQYTKGTKADKTRRGMTERFETFRTKTERDRRFEELTRELDGKPLVLKKRYISDQEAPFMSFSPTLFDMMQSKLEMTPTQKAQLRQLLYTLSPGQGFVKSMLKKKGTPGFSEDALRSFSRYFQHLANHVARLEVGYILEDSIKAMEREANASIEGDHPSMLAAKMRQFYARVMNPGNELSAIRGAMFMWAFWGVPKQFFVNLTQTPLFTYPYLAKRLGDVQVTKSMMKMSRYLRKTWVEGSNLPDAHKRAFNRAMSEEFMNESAATEMAGIAEAPAIARNQWANRAYYYGRVLGRYGIAHFTVSEEYNRRLSFLSAFDVAMAKGMDENAAYNFAKDTVIWTQFEYASWNRPELMRGKKSVLFIFKMFQQGYLYYAMTNKGGWRFWALQLAAVGMMGLPGAEHAKNLLELLGTWLREFLGVENPKLDLEKELRDMLLAFVDDPDLFIHGMSRESLGLSAMADLVGLPFPKMNINSSLAMGSFIPMVDPMLEGLTGGAGGRNTVFKMLTELSGAVGSTSLNVAQALIENGDAEARAMAAVPPFLKNLGKAHQYLNSGYGQDGRGRPMVRFDSNDPEQFGEIVLQAMGMQPVRIARFREADWAAAEHIAYYLTRRSLLLTKFANAIGDPAAQKQASEDLAKYNKTAPPELKLMPRQVRQAIEDRKRNSILREKGLPPTQRYWNLYRSFHRAYGNEPQE